MHLPIFLPTDPALLPDVNKTGYDKANLYKMYLLDPVLELDKEGSPIPQIRPWQYLVDPVYGQIGYYDKTRSTTSTASATLLFGPEMALWNLCLNGWSRSRKVRLTE